MFTPLQQIPQSPVPTEIHMGSDEIHHTPSIHEEIPATSADEKVDEEMEARAATEAEADIPQLAAPEIEVPEAILQITDTPQPQPKNPFSKTPKFKANAFFNEHVFFTKYNPYDYARLRRKRFWTASQANFYSLVMFNKDKVFVHEHIPHLDMESLPCFAPILPAIHDAGLLNFCTDICDWNEELILQFYATLPS